MGAVDKVTEEGGTEVTTGMETGQDKVWMAWPTVSFRTDILHTDRLDTWAAIFSRQLLFWLIWPVLWCRVEVLRVSMTVCGIRTWRCLGYVRTSMMRRAPKFLFAGTRWSRRILTDTICSLQLFNEGLPWCPGVYPTSHMEGRGLGYWQQSGRTVLEEEEVGQAERYNQREPSLNRSCRISCLINNFVISRCLFFTHTEFLLL